MKRYLVRTMLMMTVAALTVLLLIGSVFAAAREPVIHTDDGGHLVHMVNWMRPENWGQIIQQMTQIHGAEWTAQMLQHMNENGGSCHNNSGSSHMMGNW